VKNRCLFGLAVLVIGACIAHAQQSDSQPVVPQLIRFGGSLAASVGPSHSGLFGVTFSLYEGQTGGSPLWIETQNVPVDGSGHYTVLLGSTKAEGVPPDLFTSGEARWLGVQVSGQTEQPRVLLVAVPYALKALDAETVGGKPASAFMLAPAPGSPAAQDIASPAASNNAGNVAAPSISGSGKAGDLAVWTSSSKLGDSLLSETTDSVDLSVNGTDTALTVTQQGKASAIEGTASNKSGEGIGVAGSSAASSGIGVQGSATSSTGATVGVAGISASSEGTGVSGEASSTSGTAVGVAGTTAASGGAGVVGTAASDTGDAAGVEGNASSPEGIGVNGVNSASSGEAIGVQGTTASSAGYGVYGVSTNSSGGYGVVGSSATGPGVYGETPSTGTYASAVFGDATATSGKTYGVSGETDSTEEGAAALNGYAAGTSGTAYGVQGEAYSTSDGAFGVYGGEFGASGSVAGVSGYTGSAGPTAAGVYGFEGSGSGSQVYGVSGATGSTGNYSAGVYGAENSTSGQVYGVLGETASSGGVAGFFLNTSDDGGLVVEGAGAEQISFNVDIDGNAYFAGDVDCSNCGSKLDDPLDPANKFLHHSVVESPEMMNVYNGNITTNGSGLATVVLPRYFEALNRDFRYQLTVIGKFAQAMVAQEISQNQFTIKTSEPNVKVSWQVTGIRHDPWANAHRIPDEMDKPANKRGYYLHPDLYGAGPDKNIHPRGFAAVAKTHTATFPKPHAIGPPPRPALPASPAVHRPLTPPVQPTPSSMTSQRVQSVP